MSLGRRMKVLLRPFVGGAIRPELDSLHQSLARLEARLECEAVLSRSLLLTQRSVLAEQLSATRGAASNEPAPQPRKDAPSLDESLARLRSAAPVAFELWQDAFELGRASYQGLPTDSCSVDGHAVADQFRQFLRPYHRAPVLDVGCGPQPVPLYLEGFPPAGIAGIDPLLPVAAHPFVFHHGLTEFLPWDDASFQLVIAATSLDHVLLLDRTLQEVRRVLRKTGRFVVWVSFTEGAPRYDPYSSVVPRIDRYHLFHFDRPWFEELMSEYFACDEIFHHHGGASSFYSFRAR